MFLEVVKAQYINNYKIHLIFNNQVEKTVDLKDQLVGKVFEPLKEIQFFKNFSIPYNTIEWANGADFAPEFLYELPDSN
ncbi:MAG: DUF2442 domain-containing protein [Bacteroidetes bacterium]|nr:DUF2442 domain-containing protein [Bacteroidota bacterium]MCL2303588.1 DUF2442 domain-containing protein [Lentimicrobiaceae bacterium]